MDKAAAMDNISAAEQHFHFFDVYFLPMRKAEPHALCPSPEESLSRLVSFVRDPPTWLPSVLVGHLYGFRSPVAVCPGLRAIAVDMALRWAAMNSRRSVFTIHGDAAAGWGGGANLGDTVDAGALVAPCWPASASVWGWAAGVVASAAPVGEGRACLDGGQGRLVFSDPWTSCREQFTVELP